MDFSQRLKCRERYSHVRENENGMALIDYMTANFLRFSRNEWLEKIELAQTREAKAEPFDAYDLENIVSQYMEVFCKLRELK